MRYDLDEVWKDEEFVKNLYDDENFFKAVCCSRSDSIVAYIYSTGTEHCTLHQVEEVYREVNYDEDKKGLDFIGAFVDDQFKRQINEHLRNKMKDDDHESKSEAITRRLTGRPGDQWAVHFSDKDGDCVISCKFDENGKPQRLAHDLPELFDLSVKEAQSDDSFCWAVFKNKKLKGKAKKHGIDAKGAFMQFLLLSLHSQKQQCVSDVLPAQSSVLHRLLGRCVQCIFTSNLWFVDEWCLNSDKLLRKMPIPRE